MTPTDPDRIAAALLHPTTLAVLAGTDPRDLAAVAAVLADEGGSLSMQIMHPARARALLALADALHVASR